MNYLVDTAEMPVWTGERDAPMARYTWGEYTSLGPFKPQWRVAGPSATYAARRDHQGRHNVKARWGSLRRWARNVARELGDFMVGAFQPIREAI